MSYQQPPYGGPSPQPGYGVPPGPPRRPRPSAWWFALGGGLVIAAIAVFVGLLVWAFADFFDVDTTVADDGQTHSVGIAGDEERMVWAHPDEPASCSIVDAATGAEVTTRPAGADYTRSDGSGEWTGVGRFDVGSGELDVTCDAAGGPIQIGVAPDLGRLGGGVLAAVLVPLALGGLGLVVLIWTGVLFATRGPRRPRA